MEIMSEKKRILLLLGYYRYEFHVGVVRYAGLNNWILDDSMCYRGQIPTDFQADGVISYHDGRKDIIDKITASGLPAIDLDCNKPAVPWGQVVCDNYNAGVITAEHLLRFKWRKIGFVHAKHNKEEYAKRQGLEDTVRAAGATFYVFDILNLKKELRKNPKPIALMAVDDTVAIEIMQVCFIDHHQIPEDVAVVGSGNDLLKRDVTPVSLTSVDERLEERAYIAAKLLDKVMNGEELAEQVVVHSPGEIIKRDSTGMLGVGHPKVAQAMSYLYQNYSLPFTTENLAFQVGLSRRRLDELFKVYVGRTMFREKEYLQLVEVKRLLIYTKYPINHIAEKTGFTSHSHLLTAFRRAFNIAPRDFRTKNYVGSISK